MYTYFWDIETSTINTDCGHEMQVTYLSNVLTMDTINGEISDSLFFRTISETIKYFEEINETNEQSIIWSHNLDYELTHLLRDTQDSGLHKDFNNMYLTPNQDIIMRDKNAPLQVTLNSLPNIAFRDTYAIFNKSVSKLGEEINLPKLEYDYKKVRLPWDKLDKIDYDYNERDNIIVAKSLYKFMQENDFDIHEIPLTFTSLVRKKRKEFITNNYGKKELVKYYYDRFNSFISFDFTDDLMKVYQGGLTCSNKKYTAKSISNINCSGVIGVDIKSSYPYQMCTMKFPLFEEDNTLLGHFADVKYKSKNYKGYVGTFSFKNIRVKNDEYLLPISTSQLTKGEIKGRYELFNGKLIWADEIIIPATNIDIDVINLVYEYDEITCTRITTTIKEQYLRKEEVAFLLHNFLMKETCVNNALFKLMINSMYGVKVSCPIKDHYSIFEGEVIQHDFFDFTYEKRETMYNTFINEMTLWGGSIDVYSHGVFITSFARKQLIEMMVFIVDNGGKVVYSDTDSIKFFCDTKEELNVLTEKIMSSNKETMKNNKSLPRFKNFKKKFNINDNDYDILSTLGVWELEDKQPHEIFLTFGAKKYGYVNNGTVKTTIAGCNKKNVPKVIHNLAKNNDISLIDSFKFVFTTGATFDTTASGRTTAYKEKREYSDFLNMTYKGTPIKQFGGIIIKDTTYTLNMTLKDSKLLFFNETDTSIVSFNIEGGYKFE